MQTIDGISLNPLAVTQIANGALFRIPEAAIERVRAGAEALSLLIASGEPIYGVTTGVGALDRYPLEVEARRAFQLALVRSHAASVGEEMSPVEARAMMVARLNVLVQGHSAAQFGCVQLLSDCLHLGVTPCVPRLGSTGASGDLAPLAHLACMLVGEGSAWLAGRRLSAAQALRDVGLAPVLLDGRDGLALINGCDQATGAGSLYLQDAVHLADAADLVGAASAEALFAFSSAFGEELHALKSHPGQVSAAQHIRALLTGSSSIDGRPGLRDILSVRSMPQVHGALRDALETAELWLSRELNSANDNPLIWWDPPRVVSNGSHFHGQHAGMALDLIATAVIPVAVMSDRRLSHMMDEQRTGLTPFLAPEPGRTSGLMIPQYTTAALVAHLRAQGSPGAIQSVPTSKDTEDHNAMTSVSLERLRTVLDHSWQVLAVEALAATQALEARGEPVGEGAARLRALVRTVSPPLADDRSLSREMMALKELLRTASAANA